MCNFTIIEVNNTKDLDRFIKFPDQLYKENKQYVPALHSEQRKSLTEVSSLSYCKHKLWLALRDGEVVGRISAMINPRYNDLYKTRRARFGWFDVIENQDVATLLLEEATLWAKSQGMTEIHGPLYYNNLGKQGMLVEGFDNIPPFNCLYNYSYYNDFLQNLGFEKECDWLQYKIRVDAPLTDKIVSISDKLRQRYDLHEANIEELKKDKEMVKYFFQKYNESFASVVYNFIPYTEEEMQEEADMLAPFLTSRTSTILMDKNNDIVAFAIALPSISKALQKAKGSLFPFAWYHLWKSLRKNELVDLVLIGAVPKWQNTGISALIHTIMSRKLQKIDVRWGITNPQYEDNAVAVNIWEKYEHELYMRRRCYIKKINN